jgi:hypothetical protein
LADWTLGLVCGVVKSAWGAGVFLPIGKIQSMQGRGSYVFSGSWNRNAPVVLPAILRFFFNCDGEN